MKDYDRENPPPPLCVFCSAPWTDDMLKVFTEADIYSGYYPGEWELEGYDTTIDITCSSCSRMVYRKEVRQDGQYRDDQKPGRVVKSGP